jgi:hypothetical protein
MQVSFVQEFGYETVNRPDYVYVFSLDPKPTLKTCGSLPE